MRTKPDKDRTNTQHQKQYNFSQLTKSLILD